MPNILIRNVDAELHAKLKAISKQANVSMQKLLVEVLSRWASESEAIDE